MAVDVKSSIGIEVSMNSSQLKNASRNFVYLTACCGPVIALQKTSYIKWVEVLKCYFTVVVIISYSMDTWDIHNRMGLHMIHCTVDHVTLYVC